MEGYTYQKDLKNTMFIPRQATSSLQDEDISVNTTLSPIEKEEANAELEKGEYVLKTDGSLLRVLGKPHYKGGTPALLKGGDFIFSNNKATSIPKEDGKDLNLLKLSPSKSKNTPATVLSKEINVPHHNKMVALLSNDFVDNIGKKSAELMIAKNMKKLKKIAALQENEKGMLRELPDFSQSSDVPEFKEGGGFIPKYQVGGLNDTIKKSAKKVNKASEGFTEIGREGNKTFYKREGAKKGYTVPKGEITPMTIEDILTNPKYKTFNKANEGAPEEWRKESARILYSTGKMRYWSDEPQYEYTEEGAVSPPAPVGIPSLVRTPTAPTTLPGGDIALTNIPGNYYQKSDKNVSNTYGIPLDSEQSYRYLTPEQKLGVANGIYNALQVTKFNPIRPYAQFTPLVQETINPQIYRNNVKSQFSQMVAANQATNPLLARINNAQHFGTSLDNINKMEADVYNQNINIANQTAQYNNKGINEAHLKNVELGKNYYDQTVLSNQNFIRENQIARNKVIDDFLKYRGDNLELAMYEAALPRGTRTIYVDPNSNKTSFTPVPGYEPRTIDMPMYSFDPNKGVIRFNNVGMDFNNANTKSSNVTYEVWRDAMLKQNVPADQLTFIAYNQWLKTNK